MSRAHPVPLPQLAGQGGDRQVSKVAARRQYCKVEIRGPGTEERAVVREGGQAET